MASRRTVINFNPCKEMLEGPDTVILLILLSMGIIEEI